MGGRGTSRAGSKAGQKVIAASSGGATSTDLRNRTDIPPLYRSMGVNPYKGDFIGGVDTQARRDILDYAPVGTKISGVYYKGSDMEVIIEKKGGYQTYSSSIFGMSNKVYNEYWAVAGSEDPYISATLRDAANGRSKYYTTTKPKKRRK